MIELLYTKEPTIFMNGFRKNIKNIILLGLKNYHDHENHNHENHNHQPLVVVVGCLAVVAPAVGVGKIII